MHTFNATLIFHAGKLDNISLVVTVVVAHSEPIEKDRVKSIIAEDLNIFAEQALSLQLAVAGKMISKSIKRQLGYEAVCVVTDELLTVAVRTQESSSA